MTVILIIVVLAVWALVAVGKWAHKVNYGMYVKDVERAGVPVTDECNHRGHLIRHSEPSFGSVVECSKCGNWSVDDRVGSSA